MLMVFIEQRVFMHALFIDTYILYSDKQTSQDINQQLLGSIAGKSEILCHNTMHIMENSD